MLSFFKKLFNIDIHVHEWEYSDITGTGWMLATCKGCGKTDLC